MVATAEALRARLAACKGEWKTIAKRAGVGYRTIRRLATGETTEFLASTLEAIAAATPARRRVRVAKSATGA